MIVGLIIRNFKIFRNLHYIPLAIDNGGSWLIGENGVGKSSVLQAIDTFINSNDINRLDINNEARSQGFETREPFIVPIYIIDKKKIKPNVLIANILEAISDVSWQVETDDFNGYQKPFAERFVKHRQELEACYSSATHYLIPLGFIKEKANDTPIPYMSFFESINDYEERINTIILESSSAVKKMDFNTAINSVIHFIRETYNFIYLPAEISVEKYSRIESDLLQAMLGEDLEKKIGKFITTGNITNINTQLNAYLEEVSSHLGKKYYFKKPSKRQNTFTQRHLISKIVESYFIDKILHRIDSGNKETPVQNLSSGEKRKALLDLSLGFLKQNIKKNNIFTILAMDEPELSLHASSCLRQFQKIKKISGMGVQTLCTTHWYGYLPVASDGMAVYISPTQSHIKLLKLDNYRDELKTLASESKGSYIDVLEIKSNHDLVQSIVASITSKNNYNWIICEGKTDKIYLESHLEFEEIDNLIVLPVGGSVTLKKIYNLLIHALEDRQETITGKVFCLLDTDAKLSRFDAKDTIKKVILRRILSCENEGCIKLVNTTDDRVSPETEIEDGLHSEYYINTFLRLLEEGDVRFEFIKNAPKNDIDSSFLALDLTTSQKKVISDFFEGPGNKYLFAKYYSSFVFDDEYINTPSWMEDIANFFKS